MPKSTWRNMDKHWRPRRGWLPCHTWDPRPFLQVAVRHIGPWPKPWIRRIQVALGRASARLRSSPRAQPCQSSTTLQRVSWSSGPWMMGRSTYIYIYIYLYIIFYICIYIYIYLYTYIIVYNRIYIYLYKYIYLCNHSKFIPRPRCIKHGLATPEASTSFVHHFFTNWSQFP